MFETVGEFTQGLEYYAKAVSEDWVDIGGGMQARWGLTIQIDDAGGWQTVSEANWSKAMHPGEEDS